MSPNVYGARDRSFAVARSPLRRTLSAGSACTMASQDETKGGDGPTMRVVRCVGAGLTPESLEDGTAPLPVAGPSQLLVRVTAVAANPVDMKQQRGDFGDPAGSVHGHDIVGVVVGRGDGVDAALFPDGSRVAVFVEGVGRVCSNGGYAEYVAAHTSMVAAVPDGLSDEQAASCILTGLTGACVWRWAGLSCGVDRRVCGSRVLLTLHDSGGCPRATHCPPAYECVVVHARVREGDTVLVTGASGTDQLPCRRAPLQYLIALLPVRRARRLPTTQAVWDRLWCNCASP